MILAATSWWVFPAATGIRTLVVAVAVVGGMRLFGKRELSQLNIADLAAIMALANAVQNAMTAGSGLLSVGLASAGTLFLFSGVLSALFVLAPSVERRAIGAPVLLVYDGRLLRARLRREAVTRDEVMQAVREHGLDDLVEVLSATLEVDGSISVVSRRREHRRHPKAVKANLPLVQPQPTLQRPIS
jgi:uncharacterized membrane protein YcaP (DUF421 family)